MASAELLRISSFLVAFARRQAARVVELPGGFAVLDDAFRHSRADNQVFLDGAVAPEAVPALADEALAGLPHRLVSVLDDEAGSACAGAMARAGYRHTTLLVMTHRGPVPAGGAARETELDALRGPLGRRWRGFLPGVEEEVVRQLVDRRAARRRGAPVVRFLAARTAEGEVASWADLYLDPVDGTAQIEDLMTSGEHLGRGYGDAVLAAALREAAGHGCGLRFLTADAADWPRHWYEGRGFRVVGRSHCFERD